ncbi:MAG: HAMP domain-containing protein [Methanophagales archaeon ANME-1-THS]|nr:MAG: HAMP domain-containing protein [Methanophagales archaeon ANME-1-THS]
MKIQTQILIIIFALVLITGMDIMLCGMVSKAIMEQQVEDHLEVIAAARARHIELFLEENREKIELIASSRSFKDFLTARQEGRDLTTTYEMVNARLESILEAEHEYGELSLLDEEGIVVASTDGASVGHDRSEDPLFLAGRGRTYIQDAHASRVTGKPVLSIATPVVEQNEFLGVLIVDMALTELYLITTDRAGLGTFGELYLVNKDGYMLTPSRFLDDAILKQKIDIGAPRGLPEQNHAFIATNYLGWDVLRVYTSIPGMEWYLLADMSEKEAFALVDKLIRLMLSLLVGLSAAGIMSSTLISGALTKPLVKLQKGTEEIMNGNLEYTVGTAGKDEIGELSRAFDTMTVNLRRSREELEKYSKGLERMVEERTKELNEKVKEVEDQRLELQKAKNELEETNRKLKASNKELQDFVYIASHDLREPMRKISSFGQLIQESLNGRLNEDERENLGFMIDGATRMQQMIDDLLTYSRLTTRAKPAERVDLTQVIEDLKNVELAVQLEETSGTIYVPNTLPAVQADRSQVHQLLQNLIGNGLKYHRKGIAPEISVRGRQENDGMIRVEVEDNGIGIDEKHYEKIFGMFQRLHSRDEYKGTGIGLAICKKIVERHGGRIGVYSTIGKGSTFWFTLPRAPDHFSMSTAEWGSRGN